jgi:hypothetical protein
MLPLEAASPSFGSSAVRLAPDPWLCVPASRRVCPYREGSPLHRDVCTRYAKRVRRSVEREDAMLCIAGAAPAPVCLAVTVTAGSFWLSRLSSMKSPTDVRVSPERRR